LCEESFDEDSFEELEELSFADASFDALSDLGLSSFFSFEPESLLPLDP